MPFGQSAGPPATARQLEELTRLLHDAGHTGFRDARGPMGFNQRQAGGRFTRDEADAFIEQLRNDPDPVGPPERAGGQDLVEVPDAVLAAELQRRGWMVIEPIVDL